MTYAQLANASVRLASVLMRDCGVQPLSRRPLGTLMQRGCDWLSVYVAAMRCGVPMLALSEDTGDKDAESARNLQALDFLGAQVLVVGANRVNVEIVVEEARSRAIQIFRFESLAAMASGCCELTNTWPCVTKETLLAYCYTGGTTRSSRAVQITHGMALHEVQRYPEVLPQALHGAQMRFLQNSSAYWGAALLGQIDVPLSVGGTVVHCEASTPDEIAQAIRQFTVTAFGAVPSVLAHLSPADVPTARFVISWAEDLPESTASRWKALPVLDLLIATEYWLSLHCRRDEGDRNHAVVGGVDVLILEVGSGCPVSPGEVGELCLAGDTISPGYVEATLNAGRYIDLHGKRYFRTRDLARWKDSERRWLEYCGRCDDMAKEGGKWIDLAALEANLQAIPGVSEAKLAFGSKERHAFVVLSAPQKCVARHPSPDEAHATGPVSGSACEALPSSAIPKSSIAPEANITTCSTRVAVERLMRVLPAGTMVHIVSAEELPRHTATGKIDQKLLRGAVEESDYKTMVTARRRRLLGYFGRTTRVAVGMCRHDPRRMLCLAYIWYAFVFVPDFHRLRDALNTHFCIRGGAVGVMFAMAWALPLQHLQRLAMAGAAHARKARRSLDWVVVFWASLPQWLPTVEQKRPLKEWAECIDRATTRAIASVQVLGHHWVRKSCAGCRRMYAVTLFPSLTHCCDACQSSDGAEHDKRCLRMPISSNKKCTNCDFAVTWDAVYCCYRCEITPGDHGPGCDRRPFCPQPPVDEIQETSARPVDVGEQPRNTWVPSRRTVEVDDSGEQGSDYGSDPGADCMSSTVVVDDKSVADLVVRVFGCSDDASADRIATAAAAVSSLDSLRALRLMSAAKEEFGKVATLRKVISCTNLRALVECFQEAPIQETDEQSVLSRWPSSPFRLWTFGWNNGLPWLFKCTRPLQLSTLRKAIARLLRRQHALRSRIEDSRDAQYHFIESAAIVQLLREESGCPALQCVVPTIASAVATCWPRWSTPPCGTNRIFFEVECPRNRLEREVEGLRRSFVPPLQMTFIRHPDEEAQQDDFGHLCVVISHAVSDGTAILPFMNDLARLYADEEARAAGEKTPVNPQPRALHFGAMLEDRLLKSLAGDGMQEKTMYLYRRMSFFDHHFPEDRYSGYCMGFNISPSMCAELRCALDTHITGCSFEMGILSLVVVALARCKRERQVKFTLVHHGRDLPGAADVVGFFTDFKTLAVPTSELASLLGVVSFILASVRQRTWRRPLVLEPIGILVNIVLSPFEAFGPFQQTRTTPKDDFKEPVWQRRCSITRPVEILIEQVANDEWTAKLYLDEWVYPMETGHLFWDEWRRALRQLGQNPLSSVLSSEPFER